MDKHTMLMETPWIISLIIALILIVAKPKIFMTTDKSGKNQLQYVKIIIAAFTVGGLIFAGEYLYTRDKTVLG